MISRLSIIVEMDALMEPYLDALVDRARSTLGEDLVGAYLAGSLALRGYEPGRSDIDVALVVGHSPDLATKQALVEALRHESLPCPARGLELVCYRLDVARSGTSEPGFEVELNTGPGLSFKARYAGQDCTEEDGRFWYAVDRSILREHGVALFGPPAGEVFGEVTSLRDLLAEAVRWHLHHGVTSADAVLGACRALVRSRSRRWLTKTAAGQELAGQALAGQELAGRAPAVVRQALEARAGAGPQPLAEEARRFQLEVLAELTGG